MLVAVGAILLATAGMRYLIEVAPNEAVEEQRRSERQMQFRHDEAAAPAAPPQGAVLSGQAGVPGQPQQAAAPVEPFVRDGRKVGRNEPCPCGSGKKYKHCHGKLS